LFSGSPRPRIGALEVDERRAAGCVPAAIVALAAARRSGRAGRFGGRNEGLVPARTDDGLRTATDPCRPRRACLEAVGRARSRAGSNPTWV